MPTRLLAITREPHDPAVRYRLGHFEPILSEAGVHVTRVVWPKSWKERAKIIDDARDVDAVVVFRCLMPLHQLHRLRQNARWLAFDFDDILTRRDSAIGKPWPLLDKVFQFRAMVRAANALTPGNHYLAEQARYYRSAGRIHVVPTTIDLARYGSFETCPDGPPHVIGWIGQRATLPYLERLAPALDRVYARHPSVRLQVIGAEPPRVPIQMPVDFVPWANETEVDSLKRLTIGLAPLTDDVWTRGKCGLRLLQYLAAGVPAVATPVGVQQEIIARQAALPATTADDWASALSQLLGDPSLRDSLRQTGRQCVEHEFTPQSHSRTIISSWCGSPSES